MLCADYALLQRHFRALRGKSEGEVDEWLLEQAAWLSQGQMRRMQPGGDHHDLLGMGDRLAEVIDEDSARAGLRIRSGGRAATFLVGDRYAIDKDGTFCAEMIEVKGLGTHAHADISSPKVTGLLGCSDALREICFQRA